MIPVPPSIEVLQAELVAELEHILHVEAVVAERRRLIRAAAANHD